jgi:hypothetical protein
MLDLRALLTSAGLGEVATVIETAGDNVDTRLSLAYQYSARGWKLGVFRTGEITIDNRTVPLEFFDKKPLWK